MNKKRKQQAVKAVVIVSLFALVLGIIAPLLMAVGQ
jgi:hypothetical protein